MWLEWFQAPACKAGSHRFESGHVLKMKIQKMDQSLINEVRHISLNKVPTGFLLHLVRKSETKEQFLENTISVYKERNDNSISDKVITEITEISENIFK